MCIGTISFEPQANTVALDQIKALNGYTCEVHHD